MERADHRPGPGLGFTHVDLLPSHFRAHRTPSPSLFWIMSATTTTTATASSWSPPSGWVGNLSAEQQKALDEFRALLKTENLFPEDRGNDATLLRFLRARKFDVKLARDMWAASEKWRKDYGTDDLFKCVSLTSELKYNF